MSYDDVAFFAADFLFRAYPHLLKKRFKLDVIPPTELEFFEHIGRDRGCLGAGGRVDLVRICEIFIREMREIKIGRVSFETPADAVQEQREVERALDEAARVKAEKKAQRKQAFKNKNS